MALSTIVAAAAILALLGLSNLEIGTPPTVTISALALVPTLVAASLLPGVHAAAVVLVAVCCQGELALTGGLTPLAAGVDSAAALVTAGMGRLTAGCASLIWTDHARRSAVEEVTATALTGRPPEDALRSAALRAVRLLRGDSAAVVVEAEDRDLLTIAAAAGPGASGFEGLTFSRAGSVSGRAMDAAGTMLVPRIDAATAAAEPFLEEVVRGWALVVPLLGEGRCTGTLVVTGRSDPRTVRPRLRRMCEGLATTAGLVVLHSARQADRRRLAVKEDRARIARELHDGVVQTLLAAGALIQLVRSSDALASGLAERLDRCSKMLDESVDDLRRYVLGLQPSRAADCSLADALTGMVEQLRERIGIDARFEAEPGALAAAELAAPDVKQIVHEGLSNVERHAAATRCRVRVHRTGASLVIEVEDDGRGLYPPGRVGGMGLDSIRWRAARLGGVTEIHGERGQGTTLRIALPVPAAAAGSRPRS